MSVEVSLQSRMIVKKSFQLDKKSEASEEVETALDGYVDPSFSVHISDSNQSLSDVIDYEPDD